MSRVFISYSPNDRSFIIHIAEDLKAARHSVWLDSWQNGEQPSPEETIKDTIASCAYFIFAISVEISDALAGEKRLAD